MKKMSPEDKLLSAIFGGPRNEEQLACEAAEQLAADHAKAQQLADLANKELPEFGPWRPALFWENPKAVALIEGVPHTFEAVGGDFGWCKVSDQDLDEIEFFGESEDE